MDFKDKMKDALGDNTSTIQNTEPKLEVIVETPITTEPKGQLSSDEKISSLEKKLEEVLKLLGNNTKTEEKKEIKSEVKEGFITTEQLQSLLVKQGEDLEKKFFLNSLSNSEKEFIKAIPGNESFSPATISGILNKVAFPKINSTVPIAKEENIDEVAKRIRGGK